MKLIFHETSKTGHYSGNPRVFEDEYESVEPEENPNDALDWIEKAKTEEVQAKFKGSLDRWGNREGTLLFAGNSHIDLAWKWRYLQTTDKCRVTLTKACVHAENIPEYSFNASQPQIFEWLRLRFPDLLERVKKHVAAGRICLVGGCWCESDAHIPSGEAWVRQRLHGQLFYKKHFNKYAKASWFPDTFGYATQIPQIMKKSGAIAFYTHKLGSNDTNKFPFTTFWWEAPDGTRLLTQVNGSASRTLLKAGTQGTTPVFSYQDNDPELHPNFSKDINHYMLAPYGKGDGGHGPTGLEVQEKLYLCQHSDKVRLATVDEYFDLVHEKIADRLPVWRDELYYEYHRGTLTTQSLVKRMNRYNEWKLPALEALNVLAKLNAKRDYPTAVLDELWKYTLLNQFHDVLPGSSTVEVYDDCWDIWQWQVKTEKEIEVKAFKALESMDREPLDASLEEALSGAGNIVPVLCFNPVPHEVDTIIQVPDSLLSGVKPTAVITETGEKIGVSALNAIPTPRENLYDIPARYSFPFRLKPFQLATFYLVDKVTVEGGSSITAEVLDDKVEFCNEALKVAIDRKTGAITSLQFKMDGAWKESLLQGPKCFKEGKPELDPGIVLQPFNDMIASEPAWNIKPDFREKPLENPHVSTEILEKDANHVTILSKLELIAPDPEYRKAGPLTSNVGAYYTLFKGDPMLHVTYNINFNAKRVHVKLDIPTVTGANEIEAEVAFHVDKRPTIQETKWDEARWENIMHTWVNMQSKDDSWGFAVINEGKYGIDYHGGNMGISVIRGQSYPEGHVLAWLFEERMRRMDEGMGLQPGWADQGYHNLKFAIYPHQGTAENAKVLQRAHLFNAPPLMYGLGEGKSGPVKLKKTLPVAHFPIDIVAVKIAELDGEGAGWISKGINPESILVVRAVNMKNEKTTGSIDLKGLDGLVKEVSECDLLERTIDDSHELITENGSIIGLKASWNPFEVKTFLLHLGNE
ncbi:MAG: alpha-mannosidase [Candidatus Hodarchaeota archaeon]